VVGGGGWSWWCVAVVVVLCLCLCLWWVEVVVCSPRSGHQEAQPRFTDVHTNKPRANTIGASQPLFVPQLHLTSQSTQPVVLLSQVSLLVVVAVVDNGTGQTRERGGHRNVTASVNHAT
jgi:hypothetical protein